MATKKKFKKKLAAMVAAMPIVNTLTQEQHIVTGEELIAQGHTEHESGEKVVADAKYKQMMPVVIRRNHEKGLMKAFAKNGREGVTHYIKQIRQIVEAN